MVVVVAGRNAPPPPPRALLPCVCSAFKAGGGEERRPPVLCRSDGHEWLLLFCKVGDSTVKHRIWPASKPGQRFGAVGGIGAGPFSAFWPADW